MLVNRQRSCGHWDSAAKREEHSMKRLISTLVLVAVAGLGIAGCGGDDDDDTNSTAGTSSGATGGEGPSSNAGETGNGGTPGTGNVTCDPTADGVCQNETDCPAVANGEARA